MIDRLMLPMSNVCVAVPARRASSTMPTWSTAPVIFGTGYAPFRGGPLNYARTRGVTMWSRHCGR
jgi:3-hydroxyacyl-CoA dehydrogenase/enoyl-CoA hydratase/3-hydroxybutyryl-CoA epimerase